MDISMEAGAYSPFVFRRRCAGAVALVHVGDFLVSGRRDIVEGLKTALSQRWQIESVAMGARAEDAKELLILNRKVVWSEIGTEYRVDPKHAGAHRGVAHRGGARCEDTGRERVPAVRPPPSTGTTGASAGAGRRWRKNRLERIRRRAPA